MQTYRLLRWSDTWFCYKLAKDPTVREASLDSRPPTLFGHLRWMRNWIRDKGCVAWIIEHKGCAGLIRFDRDTCEIGIAITLRSRNQGVALEALLSASPYFHREGGKLFATIKSQNLASMHLFRKAGYRISDPGPPRIAMEWRPE